MKGMSDEGGRHISSFCHPPSPPSPFPSPRAMLIPSNSGCASSSLGERKEKNMKLSGRKRLSPEAPGGHRPRAITEAFVAQRRTRWLSSTCTSTRPKRASRGNCPRRRQGPRHSAATSAFRTSPQSARAFLDADTKLGGLDILVNNAGLIRQSPIVEMPEEDWDFILRNNLKSVFLCSKEAGRRMIAQRRGGRIIAISSIHAVLSEPNCGHYTAAKGGIEAFCRTLATELAPHKVTVNFIRPGATFTELTIPMYTPSVKRALFERVSLKQIADASWIAAGAVFLASDGAPLHDRTGPHHRRRLPDGRQPAGGKVLGRVARQGPQKRVGYASA